MIQTTVKKTRARKTPAIPHPTIPPEKIGLAFQGGCFLAGALSTGVVKALVDSQVFGAVNAFSGTSAGALVAAMCWKHKLADHVEDKVTDNVEELPKHLKDLWLENASGVIPNQETGDFLKLLDRIWSLNPVYFNLWKEQTLVPELHQQFERWVRKHVEPAECMTLLYKNYLADFLGTDPDDWEDKARAKFDKNDKRPRLLVSATEVRQGEIVVIDDKDLFEALLDAFEIAWSKKGHRQEDIPEARQRAIDVSAEYMTKALMASGSLDEVNGRTEIKQIKGLGLKERHKGSYLDGAWAENPPIKELIQFKVDEIWMVEIFPKSCPTVPESHEAREDRKEELWQNALVEQQLYFIRKVNLWLQSGRLINDDEGLKDLKVRLKERMKGSDKPQLIEAFEKSVEHLEDYLTDNKKIDAMTKEYRYIETRSISLPAEMQPLTAGARIINSKPYLRDKIEVGYDNAIDFLRSLPYKFPI